MRHLLYRDKVVKFVALLLSVVMIGLTVNGRTLSYIITQTGSLLNTFISGLAPEGGLIIHKTVEHPFGDEYLIPKTVEFTFQVDLGVEYAGKTLSTTQGSKEADENGIILVTIKPGSFVAIRDILSGTSVTVTEIQQLPGFQVKDDAASQTVTIASRENAVVTFVNAYTPVGVDSVDMNVVGIKDLEGRDWQEGDSFTFQLDYRYVGSQDNQWIELGTKTVTYEPDKTNYNQFDFSDLVQGLHYDRCGIYAFRVFEVEGSIGGVAYDDTIGYFDVLVGDADMDGKLEIQKVTGSSNAAVSREEKQNVYHVALNFRNTYAPAGSAEVMIPIIKKVDDRSGQNMAPAGFTFELYDGDGKLVKTSEATSAAGETCIKLVYDAESAGQTYTYILKETGSGQIKAGMNFDGAEYQIQVSVIDNLDGTVSAVTDVAEVTFVNVYDPQDAIAQMSGTKMLQGAELAAGMFQFRLYQADEDFTPQTTIQTVSNNGDGTFAFEEIYYSAAGTYYYAIAEDASKPREGIIYDDTVYGVAVTVMDDGSGQLTAAMVITEVGGKQTGQIVFENLYEPEESPTDPSKPTEPDSPTTGDLPGTFFYVVIATVSTVLLWAVCKKRKKLKGS